MGKERSTINKKIEMMNNTRFNLGMKFGTGGM
jgi:hypothetical protein